MKNVYKNVAAIAAIMLLNMVPLYGSNSTQPPGGAIINPTQEEQKERKKDAMQTMESEKENKQNKYLDNHKSSIAAMTFDKHGIICVSKNNTITRWNSKTGETNIVDARMGKGIIGWDETTKKFIIEKYDFSAVSAAAFNPAGTVFVSGYGDGTAIRWNIVTGETIKTFNNFNNTSVVSIALNHAGTILAVGYKDGTIKLWNIKTGKAIRSLNNSASSVRSIAFNSVGTTLAVGYQNGTIKLWSIKNGKRFKTLREHKGPITLLAFSGPTDNMLISGSYDEAPQIWNLRTKRSTKMLDHSHSNLSLAAQPGGDHFAMGDRKGTITIWNAKTKAHVTTLNGKHPVGSLCFAHSGPVIAAGSRSGKVTIWDVKKRKNIATFITEELSTEPKIILS